MRCLFCKKGPMDGVTVYRINEKGVPGVWACRKHLTQTDATVPADVQELTDILDGTKGRT